MEILNNILGGAAVPALLIIFGTVFGIRQRFFFFIHPVRFAKTLKEAAASDDGISPVRALTQALAGTLGVGNMAGVATAVTAGGAGAVFWMLISAVCAMSLKYAEVALGVLHRRTAKDGSHVGGAMYYIKDTFSKKLPRAAAVLGGVFAVLCLANSLMTGNIVQMKAAASVFPSFPPLILGGIVAAAAFAVGAGRAEKVSAVTLGLIPVLSVFYMGVSLWIILANADRLPSVISEIMKGAFSLRSVGGGIAGCAMARAVRFGVTRGIFSNEAGLGTSPSAHACANVRSPHHQGCFGIFEVFCDTVVLCTMTAFVILLSDGAGSGLDSIPLVLYAYSSLAGGWAGYAVGASVILFAFATVICQGAYGKVALGYLGGGQRAQNIYLALSCAACIWGTVIPDTVMWQGADLVVSVMTLINITCLAAAGAGRLYTSRECRADISGSVSPAVGAPRRTAADSRTRQPAAGGQSFQPSVLAAGGMGSRSSVLTAGRHGSQPRHFAGNNKSLSDLVIGSPDNNSPHFAAGGAGLPQRRHRPTDEKMRHRTAGKQGSKPLRRAESRQKPTPTTRISNRKNSVPRRRTDTQNPPRADIFCGRMPRHAKKAEI